MGNLLEHCKAENLVWSSEIGKGYHYTNEDGEVKTIFDYQFPFPKETQVSFCAKYNIPMDRRIAFYQSFMECIKRETEVSDHLKNAKVNSILTFSRVEQVQDESKNVHFLLESEQVWPVMDKLFADAIPALSVIDVINRLCVVLRDISRETVGVIHRGLDFRKVYINAESKILMSGFFYSHFPGGSDVGNLDYLPCCPSNLTETYLKREVGSQSEDFRMLAIAAWNILSGLPFDAQISKYRLVKPEYATEELADILLTGINGLEDDSQCNAFRRNLMDCRKALNKTEYANLVIPVRKKIQKEYRVEEVD